MKYLRAINSHDVISAVVFAIFLASVLFSTDSKFFLVVYVAALAMAISAAVHNAEVIAHRLGASLGTLVLALSVTVIEVALIVSLMGNNSGDSATIARDTVFAAIMIVTNGIVGICIILGGLKFKELGFQAMGTTALMGALAVLSTLTLVLPNFTQSTKGPTYGPGQLIFVSLASLALYAALVWAQTKSHKNFFEAPVEVEPSHETPNLIRTVLSFVGLFLSLIAVVGLAKLLAPFIEGSLLSMGAPKILVGIVVALLVLAPETLAAVHAAKVNQLQNSLNLALGSGAASIALTIPAVSAFSLLANKPLSLGIDTKSMIFLALTFLVGSFTFGSNRTTALHGLLHLVIMVSYLAMAFMP